MRMQLTWTLVLEQRPAANVTNKRILITYVVLYMQHDSPPITQSGPKVFDQFYNSISLNILQYHKHVKIISSLFTVYLTTHFQWLKTV
jgi:hypothetical protein